MNTTERKPYLTEEQRQTIIEAIELRERLIREESDPSWQAMWREDLEVLRGWLREADL